MEKDKLALYCLKYAESVLSEAMAFSGGTDNKIIPISFCCYLIKNEGKNILIDTGCENMPGFSMKKFFSPLFVLRNVGLSADDISHIIITHAHHDHIEAIKHFKNANVYISKAELSAGKKYIPNNMQINIFENEYILNPKIKIIEWGGHSIGSCIVEIYNDDMTYVLAGDECYINDCIINNKPTGCFYNKNKSIEFIRKYSNQRYKVYPCHDISLKTERIF